MKSFVTMSDAGSVAIGTKDALGDAPHPSEAN